MNNEIIKDLEYILNNIDKCIIVSAFSCLGKTYLGKKYDSVLDLEASSYKWIYYDKELEKDIEKRKGVKDRIINPEYPANYIKAIKDNIDKFKVILITPELAIREILSNNNIKYYYAFPNDSKFVTERALLRGNNENFAFGLEKSYVTWAPKENENILIVNKDLYLEDVLKYNNII